MQRPEDKSDTKSNSEITVLEGHYADREKAERIPCPFLLTAYNNNWLSPNEDGMVCRNQIEHVLVSVGFGSTIQQVLADAADKSDEVRDGEFNLFKLKESNLNHSGSTGIRDVVDESSTDKAMYELRLNEMLLRFAENGRMYAEHFAAAANHARAKDPGLKGTLIQTVEFTALLEVFGRLDTEGKRYLTDMDVRGLWIDGKYPEGWSPRSEGEVNNLGVAMSFFSMLIKRIWNSSPTKQSDH